MSRLKSRLSNVHKRVEVYIVIILVGSVGGYLLEFSHAATPYASINADSGSLTSGATIQTDPTASDGKMVQFGSFNSNGAPPATTDPSLIFAGNFETGDLSQWADNQSCPNGVTVVNNPVKAGSYAAKFSVNDNDTTASCPNVPNTGNPRAQLVSKPLFKNGSNDYVGFSLFLPSGFPTDVPSNAFQIMEIYGAPYDAGPIIGMFVSGDNVRLGIAYINSSGVLTYFHPWTSTAPNPIGTAWQDFTLHVNFSPDANVGYIQLWYGGIQQTLTNIDGSQTQTMYMPTLVSGVNWDGTSTGTNSLYLNSYRKKGNILGTVITYEDEAKVGPTFDSVQP